MSGRLNEFSSHVQSHRFSSKRLQVSLFLLFDLFLAGYKCFLGFLHWQSRWPTNHVSSQLYIQTQFLKNLVDFGQNKYLHCLVLVWKLYWLRSPYLNHVSVTLFFFKWSVIFEKMYLKILKYAIGGLFFNTFSWLTQWIRAEFSYMWLISLNMINNVCHYLQLC